MRSQRPIPEDLPFSTAFWLLAAGEGPPPVTRRWRFCVGLARHADADTLLVVTDRAAWQHHLRRDCGLGWHPNALTAHCLHLADHGFLVRAGSDGDRWRLTAAVPARPGRPVELPRSAQAGRPAGSRRVATMPSTRPIPEDLPFSNAFWLVAAGEGPREVTQRWAFCVGLARHADPDTLVVVTDHAAWQQHLRRDCRLGWHPNALTAHCLRLADHGFLLRAGSDEDRWRLTVPRLSPSAGP